MLQVTVERLEGWGRWVRAHDLGLDAKASSLYVMMPRRGDERGRPALPSDDEAMQVDAVMARLKRRDRESFDVLWFYFVGGLSYPLLAEKLGRSVARVRTLRDCGIMWVDGRFDFLEAA